MFDGGPGAVPQGSLDAWLVTDERAELHARLWELAAARGAVPSLGDLDADSVHIRALAVVHTSHPTCNYHVETPDAVVVWAPEFWQFPAWPQVPT